MAQTKKNIISQTKQNSNKAKAVTTVGKKPFPVKWVAIGLFVVSVLLYANTIKHSYVLDDNLVIYGNKLVKQGLKVSNLGDIFTKGYLYGTNGSNYGTYRPATIFMFALEIQLFGKDAYKQQHFMNILYYALTVLLLYLLLIKIFRKYHPAFPLIVTLLYLAHPLHTEVVANIKSRDEIFAFLFGLVIPLLLIFKFLEKQSQTHPDKHHKTISANKGISTNLNNVIAREERPKQSNWLKDCFATLAMTNSGGSVKGEETLLIWASISFLWGLLSKENALTFIVIIPLTLYFFTELSLKNILKLCIPFAAMALLYIIARSYFLVKTPTGSITILENVLIAAKSINERFATIFYELYRYIVLLIFPHPLSWDYSFSEISLTTFSDIFSFAGLVIYVALFAYAIINFRKKSIFSYCILFYLISISVVSNIFVMNAANMAERFMFTPSLAFCILLAAGVFMIFKFDIRNENLKLKRDALLIFVPILLLYSIKTFSRNNDWENSYTITRAGVEASPGSARTHSGYASYCYNYAMNGGYPEQYRRSFLKDAQKHFTIADSIMPGNAELEYEMGIVCFTNGDTVAAEKAFRKNIALKPKDKKALNNIAGIFYFRKQYDSAFYYFKRFADLNPKDAKAVNNLGDVALKNLNNPDEAIYYYLKAIKLQPSYADPYESLGKIYYRSNDYANAVKCLEAAINIDPSRKKLNKLISDCYLKLNDNQDAVKYMFKE